MSELQLLEKNLDVFVQQNNLKPADAIQVKKQPFKLLRHYILYLGTYQDRHVFMANTFSGVKIFNYHELLNELKTFIPEKIERFIGTFHERKEAVTRALMRKDEDSYNLILNNCEHFKNWVHYGTHKSEQVTNWGKAGVAVGAAVALGSAANKSKGGAYIGLGLMLLGGLAWALSDDENNIPAQQHYPNKRRLK
ncbi:MAG: lecithin retinol acyltransferase family protein [Bacteroidetes bacterium]|nr:lecithin retinol acyltransferase family protein [Bacteroidota bacterium]